MLQNCGGCQWIGCIRKQAYLLYMVVDAEGPAEDVMCEILKLLQDVFEYAVAWLALRPKYVST